MTLIYFLAAILSGIAGVFSVRFFTKNKVKIKLPKAKPPELVMEIIKTSNGRYRLKIKEELRTFYVMSYIPHEDFHALVLPQDIQQIMTIAGPYDAPKGGGTDFLESALPNLRILMDYYEKYKTFDVVGEDIVEKRVVGEPQPTLSEAQITLLELVPRLIEADKQGNKEEANALLDQMYSLNLIPNGQENKKTAGETSSEGYPTFIHRL